ncbi:MAG: ABC transporter substrate-binding protein, partial [Ferruginibacter sp.]
MIRFTSCLFCFIAVICSFSCNKKQASDKTIFRYNESSGIASLDPAFAKNQSIMWAVHQLYNTLVEVDDSLRIQPSLAKRWEFSEDKKTILFFLRTDVFFHNDPAFKDSIGRMLTADDVVFSFQRILNPETASSGAWIFNNR